jgi:hypothetical protein
LIHSLTTLGLVLAPIEKNMCLTVYQEFGCGHHHEHQPKPRFNQCARPKSSECEYTKGYSFTPLCMACKTLTSITTPPESILAPTINPTITATNDGDLNKQEKKRKAVQATNSTVKLKVLDVASVSHLSRLLVIKTDEAMPVSDTRQQPQGLQYSSNN